jgi:hypothetical protein
MANSDQFVEWDSNETLYAFQNGEVDGGIVTYLQLIPSGLMLNLVKIDMLERLLEKDNLRNVHFVGIYSGRRDLIM